MAEALRPHFAEVRILDYRHWSDPDSEMDIEQEITRAAQLGTGSSDYIIVAKSVGTVVATLAIARNLLRPARCVFMGFPLKVVHELPEMATALGQLPPTIFLHNENDPLGSAEAVALYIKSNPPKEYSLQTLPGDTHDYLDFELLSRLATTGKP